VTSTPGPKTLYDVLAAPAPEGVGAGETMLTLSKETLDADSEMLETVMFGG
jgi:hypothetical protein